MKDSLKKKKKKSPTKPNQYKQIERQREKTRTDTCLQKYVV